MAKMRIEKLTGSLPGSITANTMYFIQNGATVELYITDQSGNAAFLISGGVGSGGGGHSFLHMGDSN